MIHPLLKNLLNQLYHLQDQLTKPSPTLQQKPCSLSQHLFLPHLQYPYFLQTKLSPSQKLQYLYHIHLQQDLTFALNQSNNIPASQPSNNALKYEIENIKKDIQAIKEAIQPSPNHDIQMLTQFNNQLANENQQLKAEIMSLFNNSVSYR